MIIWSSDLTELIYVFEAFASQNFSRCPLREVENNMCNANSYTFEACFDKDMDGFG